jgi:hypothetical protein
VRKNLEFPPALAPDWGASLAHPDEPRFKTADRAARGEQKRRAPERRHAAERDHEGWHLQPRHRQALQEPSDKADPDRGEGSKVPAVACCLLACADCEAIGRHRLSKPQPRPGRQKRPASR